MSNDSSQSNSDPKIEAELKRRRRTVRNFPASTFEDALEFASQIFAFGSGQAVRRLSLFDHLAKAPESGPSRQLITNSGKYGLIKGGAQAEFLELTSDGRLAVDEESSMRERRRAQIKLAIEEIEPFKKLYDRFSGSKLPAKAVLIDTAKEFDISPDAAEEAVETFILNLRFLGLLTTLSGADRIISVDHLLDNLPGSSVRRTSAVDGPSVMEIADQKNQIITSEHAQFETTCFYISPIGEEASEQRRHSDLFLGSLVEPALESFGLKLVRADQIDRPGVITKQIIEYIVRSRIVIVDLSFHNPNVFYELAIRHMMRLPIVQIARVSDRIPFDINQMRTVRIDTSDIYSLVPKIEAYRAEISSHVRRALDSPESVDTPINTFFPGLTVSVGNK